MDVDIDLKTTFNLEAVPSIKAIRASMIKNHDLHPHPCGYYFQTMPTDPVTGLAAIPYTEAATLNFFKIDFLHLSVLDFFKNKQQIRDLINKEPNWKLLERCDVVERLFQISKHFELVQSIKPRSISELADTIALIRPGKKYLVDSYINSKDDQNRINDVRKELYAPVSSGYFYKKAHAVSYAMNIVLQLHLIELGAM